MNRFIVLISCIILFVQGTAALAVDAVVRAFESRYQHARTLKASFFEAYRDGKGGVSADSGTAYFSRPGRMRWEYESPEQKLFLVDGTNVWFYVPADHTVSRAKLSQSDDWRTPLALLAGKTDLSKLCRRIEPVTSPLLSGAERPAVDRRPAPANSTSRCIPRESPESGTIRDVLLEIDPQGFLVRILIEEAGDASTEFRFANWQQDVAIPEIKFHFEPPPGVSVVDEAALAGTIR
jgi:outer membrane lipoprotein carrier protein